MAEVTELLLILRELGKAGWPVQANEFKRGITIALGDGRDPTPTYEVFLYLYNRTSWTIAATLIPEETAEDLIRGYLEREVDARGLWIPFLNKIDELALAELDARGEPGDVPPNERRATLLEVARAALCVAKEAGS